MPLIDRIINLGLLDAAKLAQANKGPSKQPQSPKEADEEAPERGSADESASEGESGPQTTAATTTTTTTNTTTDDDDDNNDDNNDMSSCSSEDEEMGVRIRPNKSRHSPAGQAELCRQKSRRTARFHEIRHPVADEDASDGFRLWGFYNGRRVYQLDSPYLKVLRQDAVRTAIGWCYIDLKSVCPPQVVTIEVTTESETTEATEATEATETIETTETTETSSKSSESSPEPPNVQHPETTLMPSIPRPAIAKEVNGCFVIRPSALGGLGAFALREIGRGEHILVERPLLRTDLFHLPRQLDQLPPAQRAEYFALHGHHPDPHACEVERIWTANTFVAGRLEAVFVLASRFNHACPPRNNVSYRYDRGHDVLVMTAMRRIDAGTELLISYGKTPEMLYWRFGFRCTCGACAGFSEEMAAQFWEQGAW